MAGLVDIEFSRLSYVAGQRKIIKCISGQFKGGELTAVMGPSGAGKSTLMNILVGYVTSGVSGEIKNNGESRKLNVFSKLSSYIMQEDLLQPYLTVRESMFFAVRLKDPRHLDKEKAVEDILNTLGLVTCGDTFTDRLSGGQRKRVSVALELVNNPPVIFLDEPTTGLDVVATNQTMELLKLLSQQGRTVICTIHQPQASVFKSFDSVYLLARGKCIYQGPPTGLVPFLSRLGYCCPETYNPADFVFEVLNGGLINRMSDEIQNGRLIATNQTLVHTGSEKGLQRLDFTQPSLTNVYERDNMPFITQFKLLLSRMMIQKKRHKESLRLLLIHHVVSAVLMGCIFQSVGNDATRPFENFKFILCVSVFFMYTYCMIPVLTYPHDIKLMEREYFNKWYSLKAFYLAKTLSTVPLNVLLGISFTVIVYVMADQPLEAKRFSYFLLTCILVALISEGLGILIGFMFSCTNGTIVGPSTMAPILMLAMHGMGYGQKIEPFMYIIMKMSYLRYAIVSLITALYLDNREMTCLTEVDPYCYYRDAKLVVRDLAMDGEETAPQFLGLIFYLLLFRIAAYFALRIRVTTEFTNKLLIYTNKILKK